MAFQSALSASGASAQGPVIVSGQMSSPLKTITSDGVEILSGGGRSEPFSTTKDATVSSAGQSGVVNSSLQHVKNGVSKESNSTVPLVSPRLTALPSQPVVVIRTVDPRDADTRSVADGRVEILAQELAKESTDLVKKQRLLRLPAGHDPLVDELRDRINKEIHLHEQDIVELNKEIARIVQEQRHHRGKF